MLFDSNEKDFSANDLFIRQMEMRRDPRARLEEEFIRAEARKHVEEISRLTNGIFFGTFGLAVLIWAWLMIVFVV